MPIWRCICLLILSATLVSLAAADSSPTDLQIDVNRLGIPSTDSVQTSANATADERVDWSALDLVWSAASDRDWVEASRGLNRLQQNAPEWTPPPELTRLIEQGVRERRLATAFEEARWDDVLDLIPETGHFCPAQLEFWAGSAALWHKQRQDALRGFLERALIACGSAADQQAVISRAIEFLSLEHLTGLRNGAGAPLSGDALEQFDQRISQLRRDRAIAEQNWTELASVARQNRWRADTVQAAWGLLADDPKAARREFEYALSLSFDLEAEYGAALAAFQTGDTAPALRLSQTGDQDRYQAKRAELTAYANLREATRSIEVGDYDAADQFLVMARGLSPVVGPNAKSLSATISLARADAAYAADDFDSALTFARAAESVASTRDGARSLIAWTYYEQGDDRAAFDAFATLYQATQSPESADGLVLVASRAGWLERVRPIAAARSGPLLDRLATETAQRALQRKDYLIAQQAAPVPLAELVGIDRPYVRQSVSVRGNDGTDGAGKVTSLATRSSVGFASRQTHFEIGVVALQMDAGTPQNPLVSSEETSTQPFIRIEREGRISVAAEMSTTPTAGSVGAKLTGSLEVARHTDNGSQAELTVFDRSVDESLTSTFGRQDSATGETWGRVIETGVEVRLAHAFDQRMTANLAASASTRRGENIADNPSIKVDVSLTRSFSASHHDYLSAGPFYQFQAFDQNTNFHTPEHGGYFSPQSYHRVGMGVYGQTEDLKSWMLRYEAAAAIETTETDSAPVRPLTDPGGAQFGGGSQTNLAGSGRIEFARKLNANWTFSAGASAIASNAFNEVQAGLALKFVPGRKARVSTRDFASYRSLGGLL